MGQFDNVPIEDLMKKHEELSRKKDSLEQEIYNLSLIHEQMLDDLELLELTIMWKSNKGDRWK